jgi:uncharacterized protein (DUF433 family)
MPSETAGLIVSDPDICHGKPCFKGTRVMVATVLELLEAGQSQADILAGFPQLGTEHIKAALHFAAELVDGARAPAAR